MIMIKKYLEKVGFKMIEYKVHLQKIIEMN